ncbi:epsilon-sarcoglycan-like isoform X2 [Amphiura filiformis]|uniref:epsilon-sarcoglycan-like isoform X2 n=1 Tax=Amphiura filiformis TaxID=82378 RepID=UPI003B20DC43
MCILKQATPWLIVVHLLQCVLCEEASVDLLFHHTLNKDNYFDKYSPASAHPIVFKPSLIGKPGLPGWLNYRQTDPSEGVGYVYGTPSNDNVGNLELEIVGLNTYTYETSRVLLDIAVRENAAPPRYLASFFLADQSVDEFLNQEAQTTFLSSVTNIWPNAELHIYKLQTGRELGLPRPLPTDANQAEGVAVVVASREPFSSDLKEAKGRCTKYPQSVVLQGYSATWCDVNMTDLGTTTPSQDATEGEPIFLGGEYNPPPMPAEESSHMLEFILIVAIPFGVVLLVILILAYIMYGRREGMKTRESRTSSLQLTHHLEIRHASRDLRELSTRRDPATPVSRRVNPGPGESVASSSSGGPSPRHRTRFGDTSSWSASSTPTSHPRMVPPPGYRLPPHPGGLQETSFSHDSPGSGRYQSPIRPARGYQSPGQHSRGYQSPGQPARGYQSPGQPAREVSSTLQPPPPPFIRSTYGYGGGTIPVRESTYSQYSGL